MKTYEITIADIKDLEVLAEGYKVVKYDNGTLQSFRYGEKGESLVGKIFKVDGNINECKWGLHFSKDPANVFNFYEPLGYNKYFKVRAYGKVIDSNDSFKSVAQIIEFVEEYDIMQYINIIKGYDRTVRSSTAASGSTAVSDSTAVSSSYAVSSSNAVSYSTAVSSSYAVRSSTAVSDSYGLRECEAVKYGIFCYKKEGAKYVLFNKKVTKERFEEVFKEIKSFNWTPKWDNFYELKGNKEWWSIAFPELMSVDNKTAWSKIPPEMLEYIKSLPEYNEKIFKAITE